MGARVGIRQWWALLAVAKADGEPVRISVLVKAIRERRPTDSGMAVVGGLLAKRLIECTGKVRPHRCGYDCTVILTDAGWEARPAPGAALRGAFDR